MLESTPKKKKKNRNNFFSFCFCRNFYNEKKKKNTCKLFSGTTSGNKLSLSADSIDSESISYFDRNRSKSILKKSASTRNTNYTEDDMDGDTEKLIIDNSSPNMNNLRIRPPTVSPFFTNQVLGALLRSNNNVEQLSPTSIKSGSESSRKLSKTFGDNRNKDTNDEKKVKIKNIGQSGGQSSTIKSTKPAKPARKIAKKKRNTGGNDEGTSDVNRLLQDTPTPPRRNS